MCALGSGSLFGLMLPCLGDSRIMWKAAPEVGFSRSVSGSGKKAKKTLRALKGPLTMSLEAPSAPLPPWHPGITRDWEARALGQSSRPRPWLYTHTAWSWARHFTSQSSNFLWKMAITRSIRRSDQKTETDRRARQKREQNRCNTAYMKEWRG